MTEGTSKPITLMLTAAASGDAHAAAELLQVLYHELRALARSQMKKLPPGQTLQPTALVHETYLKLIGNAAPWQGRAHFFGAAAQAMRHILVDQARHKAAAKHGGDRERVEFEDPVIEPPRSDILAVDEAVAKLEAYDARKGEIVKLRYFGGLTNEEIAEALNVSVGTIEREWRFIRAWLGQELAWTEE